MIRMAEILLILRKTCMHYSINELINIVFVGCLFIWGRRQCAVEF